MDLIIFAGQSNMQGQTECLPEVNDIVENAFEYKFATDSLVDLKHPVGENIDNDGNEVAKVSFKTNDELIELLQKFSLFASCEGNANMVPFFCGEYTNITKREVVAVHTAKGSTSIDYWQRGERGYEMLYKKVSAAIKKVNPERIYVAWLQGESDAVMGKSKEKYKEQLMILNENLKNDFGIEKFGVIKVGKFTRDERDDQIIKAQEEICKENNDFIMLTEITEKLTEDKEYMNPFVEGHYSCKGQEKIGTLAGRALGEYAKNN